MLCAPAGLAIFSALVTFFFIRPLSHDGMADEDRKFMRYLAEHGWEGDVGEEGDGDASSVDDSELEKR